MILTYKVKHNRVLTGELVKAKKVANFAICNRDKLSSANVKHVGLKSIISNQVLRKYGRNKACKSISSVNLIIPSQGVKRLGGTLTIPCLKLNLILQKPFEKVNQIELDNEYAYISVTIKEPLLIKPVKTLGVDLNTTGHCAVMAVKETGKIFKLGKQAQHTHSKYKNIRKNLQKKGLYKMVKKIKNREQRIVKDLNHKISRFIVNKAVENKAEIRLEDLKGIRKTTKGRKSFRYALNSWSYYQLGQFIQYKALLAGIPLSFIEPAYTSKCCSKCGHIGERNGKYFKCNDCLHVEHADVNAAFNIAYTSKGIVQLQEEKRFLQRESDTPQRATLKKQATLEPHRL
jgi:putative transposase